MRRFCLMLAALAAVACGYFYVEREFSTADRIVGGSMVTALLYDSVDNRVYVGAESIVVVDGSTSRKIARIPHGGARLGLNPVSRRLYALGDSLRIIDLATRTVVRSTRGDYDERADKILAYCSAGNKMYFSNGATMSMDVFDGISDSLLRTIPGVNHGDIVYSPASNKLYCREIDDCVFAVIDCATDSVTGRIPIPGGSLMWWPVCYDPDDDRVYCGGDEVVLVIDCATDSSWTIAFPSGLGFLVYGSGTNSVYGLSYEDRLVRINCASDSIVHILELPVRYGAFGQYYSPTANKLYCAADGNQVFIIDCRGDSIVASVAGVPHEPCTPFCHNSMNNLVYVGAEGWGVVTVIDGVSNQVSSVVSTMRRRYSAGLSCVPSRNRLYCLYREGTMYVFDCSNLRLTGTRMLTAYTGFVGLGPCDTTVYCLDPVGERIVALGGSLDSALVTMACNDVSGPAAIVSSLGKLYCRQADSGLAVFDLAGDSLLCVVNVPHRFETLIPDPDLGRLFVGSTWSQDRLTVLDVRADTTLASIRLGVNPLRHAYSPVQNRLYAFASDDRALVVDCSLYQVVRTLLVPPRVERPLWNPRNDRLYAVVGGSILMVLDCARDSLVAYCYLGEGVRGLDLDTAGNRLFATTDQWLCVYDCWGDTLVASLGVAGGRNMAWCPSYRRLFISTSESTVTVVREAVGVEEGPRPQASSPRLGATVVRGVLWLAGAGQSQCVGRTGLRDSPCAVLLDAAGRRVLELQAGPNDVRHLSPGVYFVRPASSVMRGASRIERMSKVVVTR